MRVGVNLQHEWRLALPVRLVVLDDAQRIYPQELHFDSVTDLDGVLNSSRQLIMRYASVEILDVVHLSG